MPLEAFEATHVFAAQSFANITLQELCTRTGVSAVEYQTNSSDESRLTPFMQLRPSTLTTCSALSGNRICSLRMDWVKEELVLPRYGRLPNSSSYATIPRDHQSTVAK